MTQELKNEDFENKVIKSKGLVLVDFFASWCGPCQMMGPIIDELSKKYSKDIEMYKLDIDANNALADQFKVDAVPTLIVFKDGKILDKLVGFQDKEMLEDKIKNLI